MVVSIVFAITIPLSLALGFCLGRWHEQDERRKEMGEAIRLMGHTINMFPKTDESMDAFRRRIIASLRCR